MTPRRKSVSAALTRRSRTSSSRTRIGYISGGMPDVQPLLPRIICGRRQFRDFEPREKRIDEAHVGNAPHERPRSKCLAPTGAIVVISLRAAYFVGKSSAKDRHVVAPAEEVQMCEGSVTRIRAHSIAFEYTKPRL